MNTKQIPKNEAKEMFNKSSIDIRSIASTKAIKTNNLDEKSILSIKPLIEKEMVTCAKRLGIEPSELNIWIHLHHEVPDKSILTYLRIANQHDLDPLKEEILLNKYETDWQTSISVDGWIKLIQRHPAFSGISFYESPEQHKNMPLWIECTIHRSDRVIPTTAREYLIEVWNQSDIWQKMPRRMLRHRALQQCARIAFGIATPEANTSKGNGKYEPWEDKQTNRHQNFVISDKATQSEKLKKQLLERKIE